MARLEQITRGATLKGILPDCLVSVIDAKWHGSAVIELTCKDPAGRLGNELLYRDNEPAIEIVSAGASWSFDGDGAVLRLASEAYRIRLAEQWQDELWERFHLRFEIMTNDKIESAVTGNWLVENPPAIFRLDKLSRDTEVQAKLERRDWDLIVVDEAHRMSASFFGGEVKETKRYKLGRLLSQLTRHLLLLTATPHNRKDEDFQLFLALLDGDRFEGRFRDGVHVVDASDLMSRMVKEQLLKFDGTPLFPERRAYTIGYKLSNLEADLYERVTSYVWDEFNRADALGNDGRKGTVGFALAILQRRLCSSPEASYQSLRRRRELLEKRLREEQVMKRGIDTRLEVPPGLPPVTDEDLEELEDVPSAELETAEETVVDEATAAQAIAELQAEIGILKGLDGRAKGAGTVTITKNEILTGLNKPEDFVLAIVEVEGDSAEPL